MTNVEHWLNDERFSIQKDERAKPGSLPNVNDLLVIGIIAKKITFILIYTGVQLDVTLNLLLYLKQLYMFRAFLAHHQEI
jgi:hypothetical protein